MLCVFKKAVTNKRLNETQEIVVFNVDMLKTISRGKIPLAYFKGTRTILTSRLASKTTLALHTNYFIYS